MYSALNEAHHFIYQVHDTAITLTIYVIHTNLQPSSETVHNDEDLVPSHTLHSFQRSNMLGTQNAESWPLAG